MFPGKPHEGYSHMPLTRRSPGWPSRGQCPAPSSPQQSMSGGEPCDIPDGFAHRRALSAEALLLKRNFGANRIGTCLGWDNEAFLPGKVTGFWAELQAPSACQSICLDWGRACAGRSHKCPAKRRAMCHGPMGGVGGLRRTYKMSRETAGAVIAFKR